MKKATETSDVAFGRFFEDLSNGHRFSIVQAFGLAEIRKTSCLVFFFAIVTCHSVLNGCFSFIVNYWFIFSTWINPQWTLDLTIRFCLLWMKIIAFIDVLLVYNFYFYSIYSNHYSFSSQPFHFQFTFAHRWRAALYQWFVLSRA